MSFSVKRKPKNDESRPFPAWVIVLVALGVVVVAVIAFRPAPQANTQQAAPMVEGIELTATAIIQQATAMAQITPQPVNNNLDPFMLTATAIIQQATTQAGTPGS